MTNSHLTKSQKVMIWQRKRTDAGLCSRCGAPRVTTRLCGSCQADTNRRNTARYQRKTNRVYGAATALILEKARSIPEITWRDLSPPLDPQSARTMLWKITRNGLLIQTRHGKPGWFNPDPSRYKLNAKHHA